MKKRYVFIDTNVWISPYENFNVNHNIKHRDYVRHFKTLYNYEKKNLFEVLINESLKSEFIEKRSEKFNIVFNNISEKLKLLKNIQIELPSFIKEYYTEMFLDLNNLEIPEKFYEDLIKIIEDFYNDNLEADFIKYSFFGKERTIHPVEEKIFKLAERRVLIGKSPGKNKFQTKNIGDAINWEWIMQTVENDSWLYFITSDSDFWEVKISDKTYFKQLKESKNIKNRFKISLQEEIMDKKNVKVVLYKNLNNFLDDIEKEFSKEKETIINELIDELLNAISFSSVKSNIIELEKRIDYINGKNQLEGICSSFLKNNQIFFLANTQYVSEFYTKLQSKNVFQKHIKNSDILKDFYRFWVILKKQDSQIYNIKEFKNWKYEDKNTDWKIIENLKSNLVN